MSSAFLWQQRFEVASIVGVFAGVIGGIVVLYLDREPPEDAAKVRLWRIRRRIEWIVEMCFLCMAVGEGGGFYFGGLVDDETRAAAEDARARGAMLHLRLEEEIERRSPRRLAPEQQQAMVGALEGRLTKIAIVYQDDPESQAFAFEFLSVLQSAKIDVVVCPASTAERWVDNAGLSMFKPGGVRSESDLKEDPLYLGLKAAGLFGGYTALPFASPSPASLIARRLLSDVNGCRDFSGYILYVGQKSPNWAGRTTDIQWAHDILKQDGFDIPLPQDRGAR